MLEVNKTHLGDCMSLVKKLKNESVDCVITSPPYWQLRDYEWDGQWGLEPTYQMYLDNLINLMSEIKRVLKKTGTVWINLGDTYSGNRKGNDDQKQLKIIKSQNSKIQKTKPKNISKKSLILIPHRFAIRCMEEQGWIVRNDIIWAKRNGMPESVKDRFSKKHEYIFLLTKTDRYYFDLDSIKDKTITFDYNVRDRDTTRLNNTPGRSKMQGLKQNNYTYKNPGSVSDFWDIPTQASTKRHFAQYNTKLIEKPIMAGCPEGGLILDPFAGTSTTGIRAIELNRDFIGIEGNPDFVDISNKHLNLITSQTKLF